jgi:hypothetical protein
MQRKRLSSVSRDNTAVLGQPLYLLIVILVSAIIIGVLVLSVEQLMNASTIHQIEHEIDRVVTEATNMFEYADEGTRVTLQVQFPCSLRFVVFGGLPTNGIFEPDLRMLNESTSNNYYFVMEDGSIHTYHSNVRFSNQNFTQIILLHSGVYTLTLEVGSYEEKTYVAMY